MDGDRLFSRASSNGTWGNNLKQKEGIFRLNIKQKIFTMKVVRHRNRLAVRGGGRSIPEKIQDLGGPEQPDVAEGDPAHCRGVGLDGL